jgi:hypothetical protein
MDSCAPSPPSVLEADDQLISLEIGNRTFQVELSELVHYSRFFKAQFTRWHVKPNSDGAFGFYGDGDLFLHIIRYITSGIFPLFFDRDRGHDVVKYVQLLAEVRYFAIDGLEEWLKDQQYLSAVKITRTVKAFPQGKELDSYLKTMEAIQGAEVRLETVWLTPKKWYGRDPHEYFVQSGHHIVKPNDFLGDATKELWVTVLTSTIEYDNKLCFEPRD